MATKIFIIDVDLGVNIADVVSEDVQALTRESQAHLDKAIDLAKTTERVKQEKEQAARETSDKLTVAMNEAFEALVKAGPIGMPVSSVMAIVTGIIPNSSAFTLRMKHILSGKGNPYILERKKIHGTPHYVLSSYNQQLPNEEQPHPGEQQVG